MIKCKFCRREATRYHCNHENVELEHLCERHYAKWHPENVSVKHGGTLKDSREEY